MPRVRLTAFFVRSATCPSERRKIDYFDTEQRGFMLEVRYSGGKTFYQRYIDERGRERQFKIGSASILGPAAARRRGKAVVAQSLIGFDPRQQRAEQRASQTLSELVANRYLPHIQAYKRSWKTDETILRVHILPAFGSRYLDNIRSEDISALVTRMREQGYATGTSNRAVIVLRHIYNLARKWRIPTIKENPTTGIVLAPDVNRERFLSLDEAQRLISSLREDENSVAANAIMLLMLTGARRNEVTYAKWDYVDWNKRTLLVPLSKSGKKRTIALNAAALELLRSLPRLADCPYIFPSPLTGRPSPSLHFPWLRIKERAGLGDLRLHDLRHSFASFLVNSGVSLYIVQGLLGHAHARYTQRYAHLTPDTLLNAAETVSGIFSPASATGHESCAATPR
jgi:integrase